ncbi:IST1 [Candida pseudojiufengensis]|uniref:IST1 n=1 Tax=Candida pseudojiufengensis TaxID=497109 RepID=UPI002224E3D1|nr:IST1 [Candida pseudojiufengensis]KAI5959478.1 IST1 [Candida pseudojiufengensis]
MPKPIPPHLNPIRLKTNLKMSISKLKFIQDKKIAITKQQRRQLAELLKQQKESSAKIRVENIIRDDIYIELLEILELYCELLLARINLILDKPIIDKSLFESISSIIYSAQSTELKELTLIKDILVLKFNNTTEPINKEFFENLNNYVPDKIKRKCEIDPPSDELVNCYLIEIALAYNVPYSGLKNIKLDDDEENGNDITKKDDDNNSDDGEGGNGTKEKIKDIESPLAELADKPSVSNSTKSKVEQPIKQQNDFDALAARFAALKKTPK